jgi:hypothetical protein
MSQDVRVCRFCGHKGCTADHTIDLLLANPAAVTARPPTKACPYCGEQILAVAVKCKHCQSMLAPNAPAPVRTPQADLAGARADLTKGIFQVLAGLIPIVIGVVIYIQWKDSADDNSSSNESTTRRTNRGFEASSMSECVNTMRSMASDFNAVTDTPSRVSGFLGDKRHFSCEVEKTGTRGTFVQGIFEVDE